MNFKKIIDIVNITFGECVSFHLKTESEEKTKSLIAIFEQYPINPIINEKLLFEACKKKGIIKVKMSHQEYRKKYLTEKKDLKNDKD